MSAHPRPAAHTVARGHVRLDRPAIVPNDPAPPDPLDGLVRDVFAHVNGVLLLIEFVKHFGYALSYEQIAIILYGDTPDIRRDSRTHRMRDHAISRVTLRLNAALARHKKPCAIVCVRGVGYKLASGDPTRQKQRRYTPAEKTKLLQRYHYLRATQPDLSGVAICRKLGVPRRTLGAWLNKPPT
jgi:hypothetical protein